MARQVLKVIVNQIEDTQIRSVLDPNGSRRLDAT
jgi:hypothetical protein